MKNLIKPTLQCALGSLLGLGLSWLLVWASPSDGYAQDKLTVDQVSQNVDKAQSSVQDVQMDLSMEMKDSLSGATQNEKGVMDMKSPDKVLIHYRQPTEQFLYVGESMVQMYEPDQKMVYQQHPQKEKINEPFYLGVGKEMKRYISISRVSIIKNSDSEVDSSFLPLSEDAGFDKMRVFIHKKDWWPYQMEVETPSVTTKASFSNISFNQGLKDSLFEFTPPKGCEVVEGVVF